MFMLNTPLPLGVVDQSFNGKLKAQTSLWLLFDRKSSRKEKLSEVFVSE